MTSYSNGRRAKTLFRTERASVHSEQFSRVNNVMRQALRQSTEVGLIMCLVTGRVVGRDVLREIYDHKLAG